MLSVRSVVAIVSTGLMVVGANTVSGQDFPNKSLRILTSSPGGGSDFTARLIAQGLTESFGQPVIVDNRGGFLPAELAAKAPPDGYTMVIDGASFWVGQFTQKIPYDPVRDFLPVTIVYKAPQVLIVHPSVPVKSVKELIALAKAKPGELNYAFSGVGGSSDPAMELFKSLAGVNIVPVPYKGTGQAVTGLVGGEVQMMIASQASMAPYISSNKLRPLAVTSTIASEMFPRLPTVAETVPGYEAIGMQGVFVPAKTPADRINRLNQEIVRVLRRPDIKEKYSNIGVEVAGSSPEEFAATIKSEMIKWGKVIKDAGIKPN